MILHAYPHAVVATITEALGPVDRGAIYADPIELALTSARIGTVTGGGSQLNANGTLVFVDIEVALANLDDALDRFRELLQQLGAPTGSVLTFSRDGIASTISVATGDPTTSPAAGRAALDRRLLDMADGEEADDARDDEPEALAFIPEYDPELVRETAEQVLRSYQSLMIDAYAYGAITRSAYDPALFTWYDERAAEFAALGFDAVGDLKIVKDASKPEPGAGPFARRFVSRDHQHRADIFQMAGADGAYVRVMNVISELSDGTFVWSCTTQQRWDTPSHIAIVHLPGDIAVDALLAAHATRLTAMRQDRAGVTVVPVTSLEESLASEHRCQAQTAAFRRQQQMPSVDELVRLGSEPHLARFVHAELQSMTTSAPLESDGYIADSTDGGEWAVTTVDLSMPVSGPMSFPALIDFALDQGLTQVERAGSPLNPFLIYDTGRTHFFVSLGGDSDPLEIALQTLHADGVQPESCALVIDSRLTMRDGKKHDAIVVMASQRGVSPGVTWGQAYRPKGFLRSFKRLPFREQVATSKSLFDEVPAGR